MKRGISLLSVAFAVIVLMGVPNTAWAAISHNIDSDKDFITMASGCKSKKATKIKNSLLGEDGCGLACNGNGPCIKRCHKAVNAAFGKLSTCTVVTKEPCALLGKKVPKAQATPANCDCPPGTEKTLDKLHCECDESELTGKFVVAGQNVDKICMTKAEIAAAKKRRNNEAKRLAALARDKEREAYEKAKVYNAWHQDKLHPSEDGFEDECPADISEKVACKTEGFPEVCVCLNCWDYLRDELSPSDPWVLKAGERDECPNWFSYLLVAIGWIGVIGIPLLLIALIAAIVFFVRRKKKDSKGDKGGKGTPTGTVVDASAMEHIEEKLLGRLISILISADEGGFLHPDSMFIQKLLHVLSGTFAGSTELDESVSALEKRLTYDNDDAIRQLRRDRIRESISERVKLLDGLRQQLQSGGDPAETQKLELQIAVHMASIEELNGEDATLSPTTDDNG